MCCRCTFCRSWHWPATSAASAISASTIARGAGVGQRLLAEGEALARQRGCDRLEVHCQSRRERAHAFYRREGFVEAPTYFARSLRD
ncbi:GNAT family N-acetyltransferase [Xanthomonas sacchari]